MNKLLPVVVPEDTYTSFQYATNLFIQNHGFWKISHVINDTKIKQPTNKNLTDLKNFKEIYFIQKGLDNVSWVYFGRNKDNIHVFFEGSCEFTESQIGYGSGIVLYATNYSDMWNSGIPYTLRQKILNQKNNPFNENNLIKECDLMKDPYVLPPNNNNDDIDKIFDDCTLVILKNCKMIICALGSAMLYYYIIVRPNHDDTHI